MILGEDDYLIDSEKFILPPIELSRLSLTKKPEQYSVENITKLIRNHEFQKAESVPDEDSFPDYRRSDSVFGF